MKIRIKFAKQGHMKFIGHLDIMRYFQKAIKRAEVDICYSEGFSPHQKMSFAAPLGVGLLSVAEYFDIEIHSTKDSKSMMDVLNSVMADGIEILSYRELPENAKNGMSIVAAADYVVHFYEIPESMNRHSVEDFIKQSQIVILKKTKKSEKEVDIKPLIYHLEVIDSGIKMQVAQGSVQNLKPELVVEALCNYLDIDMPKAVYERLEMYADLGTDESRKLVSLESLGEDIDEYR